VALFEIRDLAKVYSMGEVEVHALRNVNLTLDEGHFVVLLGPDPKNLRGNESRFSGALSRYASYRRGASLEVGLSVTALAIGAPPAHAVDSDTVDDRNVTLGDRGFSRCRLPPVLSSAQEFVRTIGCVTLLGLAELLESAEHDVQ
jgi:hypothetical protein